MGNKPDNTKISYKERKMRDRMIKEKVGVEPEFRPILNQQAVRRVSVMTEAF